MHNPLRHSPGLPGHPKHSVKAPPRNPAPAGPPAPYLQQPCPACGRRLLILVQHLGQQVFCSHCRRALVARDLSQDRQGATGAASPILQRAERLLALLERADRNRRATSEAPGPSQL